MKKTPLQLLEKPMPYSEADIFKSEIAVLDQSEDEDHQIMLARSQGSLQPTTPQLRAMNRF